MSANGPVISSIWISRSWGDSTRSAIVFLGTIAAGKAGGLGYDYVHVAIDDHSRVAYVEVLEDETGKTCAGFLARATLWFSSPHVSVRRIMTGNGVGYRSHIFRDTARALGQRLIARWLNIYNSERRHFGISTQTPISHRMKQCAWG